MSEIILKGVGFGFIIIFLVGPVFFSLIQTSIVRGFLAGAFMSLGISISDIGFVLLSYFGLSKYLSSVTSYFGIIGGVIFVLFGAVTLLSTRRKILHTESKALSFSNYWKYVIKGIIVNIASPAVIIFWLAAVGSVTSEYPDPFHVFIFFASALVTIFIGDLAKAALANKLLRLVTARLLKILNIVIGIILIAAGVRLFFVEVSF